MANNNEAIHPYETGSAEFEDWAVDECVKRYRFDRQMTALVLPAMRCELTLRIAGHGIHTTVCARPDEEASARQRILAAGLAEFATVAACAIDNPGTELPGEPFDVIILRQGLSRLPYDQARQAIRLLMQKLKIGGKLFVCALGVYSELGDNYSGADVPVSQRFAPISPALAKRYDLPGNLCLYSERDLFVLLLESGASVLRTLTSSYGNVKAIAVRV